MNSAKSGIDTLIFDLDGTLVDSAPSILSCMEAVVTEVGHHPVEPLGRHLIGPPLRDTLARVSGVSDANVLQNLADAFKRRYDETVGLITQPFDGVCEVLSALSSRGVKLHLATNKRLLPTRRILEAQGWDRLFSTVYAQDSVPEGYGSKTDMIGRLLADTSISPARAAYIGDTREDGIAATRNGLLFVAVAWGYGGNPDAWVLENRWVKVENPIGIMSLDWDANACQGMQNA